MEKYWALFRTVQYSHTVRMHTLFEHPDLRIKARTSAINHKLTSVTGIKNLHQENRGSN